MATKVSLLKSFATGQGNGISTYITYPADHDSNYTALETTVNAIIDEVSAARLTNSNIPTDILLSDAAVANAAGRMSPWEAKFSISAANVTTTSGRIYIAGQRILVVGATLAHVGTVAQTNYLKVDQNGLLSIGTAPSALAGVYDIAILAASGGNFILAGSTDLLAFSNNMALISGNTANRMPQRLLIDGTNAGHESPSIRTVNSTGVQEDAGFDYNSVNEFGWYARRATGSGSGAAVLAASFGSLGQLQLREQSRLQAIKTGTPQNVATGATFVAVVWDTPVVNSAGQRTWRREPQTYITNPFIAASSAVLTIPADLATTAATYLWTAHVTLTTAGTTSGFVEARIRATNGTATDIALARVAAASTGDTTICLSGMMDLASGNTVQVEVRHGDAGTITITGARVACIAIGGGV